MLFPIIALSVLAVIYGYVGWRTIAPAPLGRGPKTALWALLAVFWVIPLVPILLRRLGNESPPVEVLAWIAYTGLGFFVLAFTLLLITDLARLLLRIAWRVSARRGAAWRGPAARGGAEAPIDPERRRLLAYPLNLGILGLSGSLAGYGLLEAIQIPEVVKVRVPVPGLPPELEGYRIVQLTDIHVGPMIKESFMGAIVDRTNALQPDLIAVTGDLVDGSVSHLGNAVSPLAALSARQGSYFITGNHEYYSGAEAWVEKVDRLGLRVLLNEHLILQTGAARMLVAGVTDPNGAQYVRGHGMDVDGSLSGAAPADFKLLLAHQPRAVFDAARNGFDLQLSGHTHGGQFIPWNFLVSLTQPYLKGLHDHEGTWIYVSKGTGFWGPPMRLGTRPEITLIELTSRKESAKT